MPGSWWPPQCRHTIKPNRSWKLRFLGIYTVIIKKSQLPLCLPICFFWTFLLEKSSSISCWLSCRPDGVIYPRSLVWSLSQWWRSVEARGWSMDLLADLVLWTIKDKTGEIISSTWKVRLWQKVSVFYNQNTIDQKVYVGDAAELLEQVLRYKVDDCVLWRGDPIGAVFRDGRIKLLVVGRLCLFGVDGAKLIRMPFSRATGHILY